VGEHWLSPTFSSPVSGAICKRKKMTRMKNSTKRRNGKTTILMCGMRNNEMNVGSIFGRRRLMS